MSIPDLFLPISISMAMVLLVWNCFEVGRNDAANLVNAVFGSRVMSRKNAVYLAGIFVVLGATFSSPVMDTVRKGIFALSTMTPEEAIGLFVSSYIVCTVLLYSYSAYGMPVSTTATLVFALAGGAIGVKGNFSVVNWGTLGSITIAIFISILLSGIAGFLAQRVFRGAIRNKGDDREIIMTHGPWITGMILTCLSWFLIMKGLKGFETVKYLKKEVFDLYGAPAVLLVYWSLLTLLTHLILTILPNRYYKFLFHFTAVFGMCALAFSFGQNDLANAASPGLSAFYIWKDGISSSVNIPIYAQFICGFLIFLGMTTKNAQRVTRAEVNTASQYDQVALYAPKWTKYVAKKILSNKKEESLAPPPVLSEDFKKVHYDPLRASVIMAVSASVIAFASGQGLPVSTTYVGFAAVVATGMGDKIFVVGDSTTKVARSIWVVFSWFSGAIFAAFFAAIVAFLVTKLEVFGLAIALGLNLFARNFFSKKADDQEKIYHKGTKE